MPSRLTHYGVGLLILLTVIAVGLSLSNIISLSDADSLAIWVVHDLEDPPEGIRNTVNYALNSIGTALSRTGEINSVPLYYLLLDGWVLLFGDSLLALRLPSLIWGGVALIAIAGLLTNQNSRIWGVSFVALLPGFYLLGLSVSPLMQWLALSLITSWLMLRLLAASGWLWGALYSLAALLLVLTHIYGVIILLLQFAYLLYRERKLSLNLIAPFILPLIALIVWMGIFGIGFRLELAAIFLLIGIGVMLVLLNQPPLNSQRVMIAVGALLITQFITVLVLPPVIDYEQTTAEFLSERNPLEPLIFDIPDTSIMAYYKRQLNLRSGYTLDIGWRDHSAGEIEKLLGRIQSAEHIWLILPDYREQSVQAIQQLRDSRQLASEVQIGDYRLQRFDSAVRITD